MVRGEKDLTGYTLYSRNKIGLAGYRNKIGLAGYRNKLDIDWILEQDRIG